MTTAHKSTVYPALGNEKRGGTLRGVESVAVSSRDIPGQTRLHYRKSGQNAPEDKKNRSALLAELENKEFQHNLEKRKESDPLLLEGSSPKRMKLTNERDDTQLDIDMDIDKDDSSSEKETKVKKEPKEENVDKDDDSSGSDVWSDDEDETNELQKQLDKIRKEREEKEERLKKEREKAELEKQVEGLMKSNPLLNPDKDDFTIKKKWNEDVVFRNQARTQPKQKKNPFHQRYHP